MSSFLCLDIGNTRCKWALAQNNKFIIKSAQENNKSPNTKFCEALKKADKIYISNVTGENSAKKILQTIYKADIEVILLKSKKNFGGLISHYQKTETLGVDRLLAMQGLLHSSTLKKHLQKKTLNKVKYIALVSCGTAITTEIIRITTDNKKAVYEFIGGQILPGLTTMQKSLKLSTANLPTITINRQSKKSKKEVGEIIANNTEGAIALGVFNATSGAIEKVINNFNSFVKSSNDRKISQIYFTGGEGKLIAKNIQGYSTKYLPELVLKGLLFMAK